MNKLKNQKDIYYIKKAIRIGENILDRTEKCIVSGMSSNNLNMMIESWISAHKATPSFKGFNGFPTASCISTNKNIIHGVPNDILFKNGDLVKVDIGIKYKDYFSDQARTYIVGGNPPSFLVYATKLALEYATTIPIGNTIGDISSVIEKIAKVYGLGILKDYCGHGVGFAVHEDPRVPNRVGIDKDVKLVKGMIIAIEPMFVMGKGNYSINEDGTVEADGLGSHFEKTVIIE